MDSNNKDNTIIKTLSDLFDDETYNNANNSQAEEIPDFFGEDKPLEELVKIAVSKNTSAEKAVFTEAKQDTDKKEENEMIIEEDSVKEPEQIDNDTVVAEPITKNQISCKKKVYKKYLPLLVLLAMLLAGFVGYRYLIPSKENKVDDIIKQEENDIQYPMDKKLRKTWLTNKAINEDYVGEIIFDSALIEESVVQAKDVYKNNQAYEFYTENGELVTNPEEYSGNDVYIWTDWKTGKPVDKKTGIGGSTFLDYRNEIEDKVLLVWGHHWARDYLEENNIDELPNFTQLDVLLDEDNYEENKNFRIILDNEIRSYVIAAVYNIDIYDEDDIELIINLEVTQDILGHIKDISLYTTDVPLSENDNYVALITCKQHDPDHRQVVLAKEISREEYR